ncbi:MAG TPA: L,D-transpeptidase [Anaerolineales bacterium]|nr:L,D-transpeptidase [Anaerolineales bacterium]
MSKGILSRRDFLKLSGCGLMGMILRDFPLNFPVQDFYSALQGRVADRVLWSYDEPNPKSKRKKLYWRDLVLPITDIAISEDESAYNRVWYQVEGDGFVYSGSVQPVRTILNEPQPVPVKGVLGEVSVPFTDARETPDPNGKVIYRLYYESVHWVLSVHMDAADGSAWYYLLDDKFEQFYYVPASHIRILPDDELTPLSPHVPDKEKRVEVRLQDQLVLAYEGERLVFATRASTGGRLRSGTYTTPTGQFITYHKRPTRHMAAGDLASSGFDLPGVPWVIYIKENGVSFHGTYWHNDYGRPRSHGCINLTPQAAKWLYRWTIPTVPPDKQLVYGYVGTKVEIKI